jgi:hypothetical protein
MGSDQCSTNQIPQISRKEYLSKDENYQNQNKESFDINTFFSFKNYTEYFEMSLIFNRLLKEITSKVALINKFNPPKKIHKDGNFYYFEYLEELNNNKLFDVAMCVYQKIGNVYGSSQNYPKQELGKITFGLIAKYRSYDYGTEDDLPFITEKIIKRINFFSEEFLFKLKNLKDIFFSKKVFVFGYDRDLRLNFYIEPNEKISDDNIIGIQSNKELNEEYFLFKKNRNLKKKKLIYNLHHSDYITYIFFIIEHILPLLREKFHFSNLVNLIINFRGQDANTELINYILTSFNNYYPLGLCKVHIVNFQVDSLKKNRTFRKEIDNIDYFRNLVLHNESFQFNLIKEIDINLLPIEYGGYHSLISFYEIQQSEFEGFKLEDFIYVILSMILINNDCKN